MDIERRRISFTAKQKEILGFSPSTLFVSSYIDKVFLDHRGRQDLERSITSNDSLRISFLEETIGGHGTKYIRDDFQIFDRLIFTPAQEGVAVVREILGEEQGDKEIVVSDLGIGGKVLRSGRLVIVTDDLREARGISDFQNMGYWVEFLPIPGRSEKTPLSMRMLFNGHIDTEVNIVRLEEGCLFVVNADYYERYKDDVDLLVKKYQGVIGVIDSPREQTVLRGVNFIELPDGKVVVPENCRETRDILCRFLGRERVIAARVDCSKFKGRALTIGKEGPLELCFHGGLRCLTNHN